MAASNVLYKYSKSAGDLLCDQHKEVEIVQTSDAVFIASFDEEQFGTFPSWDDAVAKLREHCTDIPAMRAHWRRTEIKGIRG